MRVGIIGCGNISETYFNCQNIYNNFKVISCSDIDIDVAKKSADKFNVKAQNVEDLLSNSEIDLIINSRKKYLQESVLNAAKRIGMGRRRSGKGIQRGTMIRLFPLSNSIRLEHYIRYAKVQENQLKIFLNENDYDNAWKHLWFLSTLLLKDIPSHNAFKTKRYEREKSIYTIKYMICSFHINYHIYFFLNKFIYSCI